ncbi:MAG: NAD(P)/FAD-dependent oxidoreductase [Bacteroidetes bacterium]|nr:NAD(P)/FAD-dependent oxidoreductase [Bacteroidota bacterium]
MKNIVIIGNGIAGVTAARYIRKMSDHCITIISDETNHFYSRTALMYIYMGHMTYEQTKPYEDWFWEKNRIDLVRGFVTRIDTRTRHLHLADDSIIRYDVLIIATGSRSNRFGWPGQDLKGVQGLYNMQDLRTMELSTRDIRRAVVVGGGLIGIEVAEMLASRRIQTTFLVRERNYWDNVLPREEAVMVGRHIREHGVDLRLSCQLREILPDENGRARAVITDDGERIDCEFVALTAGVSPNIDVVKNSEVDTARGVLVNEFMETNVPDVYAIGDCAEFRDPKPGHPRVEQLWYTGKMHGEVVARTICGQRTPYERGVWFNSAKFFDIEYQTYGFVAPANRDGEKTLYWEHQDGRRCVRINYLAEDHSVVGVNVFGIRFRQQVFEHWIREKKSIEHVLENLRAANFDPEFFPRFEQDVVALFNAQSGADIRPKTRRDLRSTIFKRV